MLLLDTWSARFGQPAPGDLATSLHAERDPERLRRAHALVLSAVTPAAAADALRSLLSSAR